MKALFLNMLLHIRLSFFLSAATVLSAYFFISLPQTSAEPLAKNIKNKADKIRITADRLVGSYDRNYAEFTGSVEAVYGDFIIKSDRLKIFYKHDPGKKEKSKAGEESIDKIIATGNVKIWADGKEATTQQAVYTTKTMVLVLTGENSTVFSNKNYVSGSKITLNRSENTVKVESGTENRVKALFYSTKDLSSKPDPDTPVLDPTKKTKPPKN
ncbi:MAG: LptA/OstA family protein [Thermodesulfobacteriota bacterium]|nr:LptA/OstA family protein [Thermodesulfobacteriota bacterium]